MVSGYRHKPIPPNHNMSLEDLKKKGYVLDEHAWLNVSLIFISTSYQVPKYSKQRILFLETIAGVPGMVAAMLRHLTSLRLMARNSM